MTTTTTAAAAYQAEKSALIAQTTQALVERTAHYNAMSKDALYALATERYDDVKKSDSKTRLVEILASDDVSATSAYRRREALSFRASMEMRVAEYALDADVTKVLADRADRVTQMATNASAEGLLDVVLDFEEKIVQARQWATVAAAMSQGLAPVEALRAVRTQAQHDVLNAVRRGHNSTSPAFNLAEVAADRAMARWLMETDFMAREVEVPAL